MIPLRKLFEEAFPDSDYHASLPDILIHHLECDSRSVKENCLFVAVHGVKKDGSEFIREAIQKGAVAVVTEKNESPQRGIPFIVVPDCRLAVAKLAAAFYGHPSKKMKAVGITGTNGKTTSSYLVEHFLEAENKKVGVMGTINYRYDGNQLPAIQTTPGPLIVQRILAQMTEAGCDHVVMEVSSHALDQNRVAGIDFETALFTNLTQDHLDYHKTFENYFECKSRLFSNLGRQKTAVLNADDPWFARFKEKTVSKTLSYGIKNPADLGMQNLRWEAGHTFFEVLFGGGKMNVDSPLIGTHNVYNVLGALGVMEALGVDVKRSAAHLKSFRGVPGRLETIDCGQNFMVFVDYAHTPDGLENVLMSLRSYRQNRLIVVFGCGGDRDKTKRPKMGEIVARLCDHVVVTSDNPRSENPKIIAEEVRAGFPAGFTGYSVVIDRKKAIRHALLLARKGDIVLLAGKGHETVQVIENETIHLSDREEAQRVLNGH